MCFLSFGGIFLLILLENQVVGSFTCLPHAFPVVGLLQSSHVLAWPSEHKYAGMVFEASHNLLSETETFETH